jgi:hypothetical protein
LFPPRIRRRLCLCSDLGTAALHCKPTRVRLERVSLHAHQMAMTANVLNSGAWPKPSMEEASCAPAEYLAPISKRVSWKTATTAITSASHRIREAFGQANLSESACQKSSVSSVTRSWNDLGYTGAPTKAIIWVRAAKTAAAESLASKEASRSLSRCLPIADCPLPVCSSRQFFWEARLVFSPSTAARPGNSNEG